MFGLEYVLIIITMNITLLGQFVTRWVMHRVSKFFLYRQTILIGATKYSSSFLDLPDLPLFPFEFNCYSIMGSLFSCSRYAISCYSSNSNSYKYSGVTCEGNRLYIAYYFELLCRQMLQWRH